jgi:hypothetical protein
LRPSSFAKLIIEVQIKIVVYLSVGKGHAHHRRSTQRFVEGIKGNDVGGKIVSNQWQQMKLPFKVRTGLVSRLI